MNKEQIIAADWYTEGSNNMAIVLTENSIGKISCRLGCHSGLDEIQDAIHVACWGAKLSKTQALATFPEHAEKINESWKGN